MSLWQMTVRKIRLEQFVMVCVATYSTLVCNARCRMRMSSLLVILNFLIRKVRNGVKTKVVIQFPFQPHPRNTFVLQCRNSLTYRYKVDLKLRPQKTSASVYSIFQLMQCDYSTCKSVVVKEGATFSTGAVSLT